MLETLKNLLLDLFEDRAISRYESFPRLGTAAGELPIEYLAGLGYVPLAHPDTLPAELTPLVAQDGPLGGWTAS